MTDSAETDDVAQKNKAQLHKKGFLSSLFTAAIGGIGAYTLMKLGTPTPDPATAAAVAVAGAGVFTGAVKLTELSEMLSFGIIIGGGGGLVLKEILSGVGSVIAGSSGEIAGTALAGVALLLGISAVVINAERERPEQEWSGIQVLSGLMAGMALSAALAFTTAEIPGYSGLHPKAPEKTGVQATPAVPAP